VISHFFIDRPIFASVLSIVIALAGGIAVFALPVALYPPITPPVVQVSCKYPGANAKVVADSVAAPIEQAVNGVDNLLYMQSQCTNDGAYNLLLTFAVGANLNIALVQTQNRVQLAMPLLPNQVQKQGVNVRKKSPDILLVVSFVSPQGRYDDIYLSNFATIQVRDELLRLYGVGDVTYLGERDYSIRAWLDPDQLATRGLTASEVVQAVTEQNQQVVCGSSGSNVQMTLTARGRLTTPAEFGAIVVKSGPPGGKGPAAALVRLRDVARIELGAQQYDQICTLDGQTSVSLAVFQVPGTNALETGNGIRRKMEELSTRFPDGLEYRIVYDTTPYIRSSMIEVVKTLRDAVILVAIVVLVFLQTWRAALIPLVAVPVAIVGTFAAMAALGFSLNTLSLFGLVLAIGIVVDDAIVVVENVQRWLEHGLAPREAARRAMEEVTGPVIGVALVLCAVFIPCAFISGVIGLFFRQFALTIAISTVLSALNSLTLSPALAALLLRPRGTRRDPLTWLMDAVLGWFFRLFNSAFGYSTRLYTGVVGGLLRARGVSLVGYVLLLGLALWGFKSWPSGFLPMQDQGYLVLTAQLPDATSVQRTQEVIARIDKIARGDPSDPKRYPGVPGIKHTVTIAGVSLLYNASSPNWGSMFLVLDDFDKRQSPQLKADSVLAELRRRCEAEVPEAIVGLYPAPPIRGLSTSGGLKLYVEDRESLGLDPLQRYTDDVAADARRAGLTVHTDFEADSPQLFLDIDRSKARTLGVDLKDVFETLQAYMGGLYVNNFNDFGRCWQVNVMADPDYRTRIQDAMRLEARNAKGEMVPLGSLISVRNVGGPVIVMRYNLYEAAPVVTVPETGVSSGQIMDIYRQASERDLPEGMTSQWSEIVYLQIIAGNTAQLLFGLGVVLVFLVLAALYESWSLPLAVVLVVPMCLLSSLAGLVTARLPVDILAMVGLVLLVGLASKNAILIVEFAKQQRDAGVPPRDATLEACRLRLRPILMTSFAFILGVVPLVWSSGAGAEMRHSLGTTVFSGMLGVTLFGVLLTPIFFYVLSTLAESFQFATPRARRAGRLVLFCLAFVSFGYLGTQLQLRLVGASAYEHNVWWQPDRIASVLGRIPVVGPELASLVDVLPPRLLIGFGVGGTAGIAILILLRSLGHRIRSRRTEHAPPTPGPHSGVNTEGGP
jgi:multidrug efflux pump